jgi:GNAT superfamily N-acetyltransferase
MWPMSWQVRSAAQSDARSIAVLNGVVQSLHHHHRPDWFKPADADAFLPVVEGWLSNERVAVFVAQEDLGPLLGYVTGVRFERPDHPLTYGATVVELDQLAVVESARNQGIGRALCERVIVWAAHVGASRVELSTWDFNDDARRLFTTLGFATTTHRMSRTS